MFIKCNARSLYTGTQFWHLWIYDLQCHTIYPNFPWCQVKCVITCPLGAKNCAQFGYVLLPGRIIMKYDLPQGSINLYKGGEFHISHDASLHAILSSFRTHVILSVQQGCVSWTTLESDVFRWCKPLYLCCGDLFTISVLLFQIYLLLSQRECFGCRYWLICRPITRQSTKMLIEAGKQDLCFSASCFDVCW